MKKYISYVHLQTKTKQAHNLYQTALQALSHNLSLQCVIPLISFQQLKGKDLHWWETSACKLPNVTTLSYYVVEKMGEDACGVLDENKLEIADYYRITLRLQAVEDKFIYFLQATMIEPQMLNGQVCYGTSHHLAKGIQTITLFEGSIA